MSNPAALLIVVGASGSGKGVLLRAVADMGERHIIVVPKVTTRKQKATDGPEMICLGVDDPNAIPTEYDIRYANYKSMYGISSAQIWRALKSGKNALLICSNFVSCGKDGTPIPGAVGAIPTLLKRFGPVARLIYLHSELTPEDSEKHQRDIATDSREETSVRRDKIAVVRKYYLDNIQHFDHVLLNVKEPEDLSDQLFRLVRFIGT